MNINTFIKENGTPGDGHPAGAGGASARPQIAARPSETPAPSPQPPAAPLTETFSAAEQAAQEALKKRVEQVGEQCDKLNLPEDTVKDLKDLRNQDDSYFSRMKQAAVEQANKTLDQISRFLHLSPKPQEKKSPKEIEQELNTAKQNLNEIQRDIHRIGHSENPMVQTLFILARSIADIMQDRVSRQVNFLQSIVDQNKKEKEDADNKIKADKEPKKEQKEGHTDHKAIDTALPVPGKTPDATAMIAEGTSGSLKAAPGAPAPAPLSPDGGPPSVSPHR